MLYSNLLEREKRLIYKIEAVTADIVNDLRLRGIAQQKNVDRLFAVQTQLAKTRQSIAEKQTECQIKKQNAMKKQTEPERVRTLVKSEELAEIKKGKLPGTQDSDESKSKVKKVRKTSEEKAPRKRKLSNEAIGDKLLAENATPAQIIAEYTAIYKEKGVTDPKFIAARADIYMRIAAKRAGVAWPKEDAE